MVQRGVLDGRIGMIYHVLQGFWFRYLVNAKLVELEGTIAQCRDNDERCAVLSRLTGHVIEAPTDAA